MIRLTINAIAIVVAILMWLVLAVIGAPLYLCAKALALLWKGFLIVAMATVTAYDWVEERTR